MPKFGHYEPKTYLLCNLHKISHVSYFECTDFKFFICFGKFRAQIHQFGHFGTNSIKFLILKKFCLYPGSEVLISNLTIVFEDFEI